MSVSTRYRHQLGTQAHRHGRGSGLPPLKLMCSADMKFPNLNYKQYLAIPSIRSASLGEKLWSDGLVANVLRERVRVNHARTKRGNGMDSTPAECWMSGTSQVRDLIV
jgi:hypothetical protein